MTNEELLTQVLDSFCDMANLPLLSAEDLLMEELTPAQHRWLSAFIVLWEADADVLEEAIQRGNNRPKGE